MKSNTETLYEIIEHRDKLISTKNLIIEEKDKQIKIYRELVKDLNDKIDNQLDMIESLSGNGNSMVQTNQVLLSRVKKLQSRLDKLTKITLN